MPLPLEAGDGYRFRFNWDSSNPFDPQRDTIEVRVVLPDGQEYYMDFATPRFINFMFEKNRRTGECAGGTYFCMPNLILVREITEQSVRETLDDLLRNHELDVYLTKVE